MLTLTLSLSKGEGGRQHFSRQQYRCRPATIMRKTGQTGKTNGDR
jgi:hypothetical protein